MQRAEPLGVRMAITHENFAASGSQDHLGARAGDGFDLLRFERDGSPHRGWRGLLDRNARRERAPEPPKFVGQVDGETVELFEVTPSRCIRDAQRPRQPNGLIHFLGAVPRHVGKPESLAPGSSMLFPETIPRHVLG